MALNNKYKYNIIKFTDKLNKQSVPTKLILIIQEIMHNLKLPKYSEDTYNEIYDIFVICINMLVPIFLVYIFGTTLLTINNNESNFFNLYNTSSKSNQNCSGTYQKIPYNSCENTQIANLFKINNFGDDSHTVYISNKNQFFIDIKIKKSTYAISVYNKKDKNYITTRVYKLQESSLNSIDMFKNCTVFMDTTENNIIIAVKNNSELLNNILKAKIDITEDNITDILSILTRTIAYRNDNDNKLKNLKGELLQFNINSVKNNKELKNIQTQLNGTNSEDEIEKLNNEIEKLNDEIEKLNNEINQRTLTIDQLNNENVNYENTIKENTIKLKKIISNMDNLSKDDKEYIYRNKTEIEKLDIKVPDTKNKRAGNQN